MEECRVLLVDMTKRCTLEKTEAKKQPELSFGVGELVSPFHLEVTPVSHVALFLKSHSCPPSDLADRTTALELARSFLRSGSSERYSAHYRNDFPSNTDVSNDAFIFAIRGVRSETACPYPKSK